jgi:hypothetical protein
MINEYDPWYKEDYTAMTWNEVIEILNYCCLVHPYNSMRWGEKMRESLWNDYNEFNS